MAITLADILTEVKQRAGLAANRAHDPDLAPNPSNDALLTVYAQSGAIKIANHSGRALAQATIPIVSGTFAYDVGNSIREVGALRFETGGESTAVALASGERVRVQCEELGAETGTPTCAGFYGDKIYLFPVPDAAGNLRVYYWAASFIGESGAMDTDELPSSDLLNNFPSEFREALVDFVLYNWYLETGHLDRSRHLLERFRETLREGRTRPRRPNLIRQSYKPYG